MSEKYITLEKIAEITGFQACSVRTYLSRAEFTKYYKIKRSSGTKGKGVYLLNNDFVTDLYNFLIVKKQKNSANAIKNYWEIYQKMNGEVQMTNEVFLYKELEKKYDIISKQYQNLLERYKESILLNKKLQIIEQMCKEPADSMAVFNFQNRIKEVLSE